MPAIAQVTTDADRSVTITRTFDAPRATVWRAFTDGAILARWLPGPPGWTMDRCEISVTPGGGYLWRWRDDRTGQSFGFKGTYLVVEPGVRLVDVQTFDRGARDEPLSGLTKNKILFRDEGHGCRVISKTRYPDTATRDAVIAQGLEQGMEVSYRRLDHMLLREAA